MKLALLNRQHIRPIPRSLLIALVRFLTDCAFPPGAPRPVEINLTLVDHAHIRPLKKRYWNLDATTDVIAFSYDAPPPAPPGSFIGDLIVNVQQAVEIGPRWRGEFHELALYLAHGLDHLSGADDATPRQRRQMRRRELAWLQRAQQGGLLDAELGPARRKPRS